MLTAPSRRRFLGLSGLGLPVLSVPALERRGGPRTATVILVRHAEASKEGADPSLTERGRARAQLLAGLLRAVGITALWATELARTRETLEPLADLVELDVGTYAARDPGALVRDHLESLDGGVAVVAGHSNTVPALTSALGGSLAGLDPRGYLDESEHDRVVVLPLLALDTGKPLRTGAVLDLRLALP